MLLMGIEGLLGLHVGEQDRANKQHEKARCCHTQVGRWKNVLIGRTKLVNLHAFPRCFFVKSPVCFVKKTSLGEDNQAAVPHVISLK